MIFNACFSFQYTFIMNKLQLVIYIRQMYKYYHCYAYDNIVVWTVLESRWKRQHENVVKNNKHKKANH